MNTRTLLILDAVLFAAICLLVYGILITTAEAPPSPPNVLADNALETTVAETETELRAAYPNLGQKELFTALIPLPPEAPPPPPPPPVAPNLGNIVQRFRLLNAFSDELTFVDNGDNVTHTLAPGDTVTVLSDIPPQTVNIRLESIDDYNFTATFTLDVPNTPQQSSMLTMDNQGLGVE
jgi:hypothetical protein